MISHIPIFLHSGARLLRKIKKKTRFNLIKEGINQSPSQVILGHMEHISCATKEGTDEESELED